MRSNLADGRGQLPAALTVDPREEYGQGTPRPFPHLHSPETLRGALLDLRQGFRPTIQRRHLVGGYLGNGHHAAPSRYRRKPDPALLEVASGFWLRM